MVTEFDESYVLTTLAGLNQRAETYRRMRPEHLIKVRELPRRTNAKLAGLVFLATAIKEARSKEINYTIISNLRGAAVAAITRLCGGAPWIWYVHDYLHNRGRVRRIAAKILFSSCAGWIANSKDVGTVTRKLAGSRKVGATFYYCVNPAKGFVPPTAQRIPMEEAVLFVGSINSWKGLQTLVEGLSRVKSATGVAPRVDIVGQVVDPAYWEIVQQIAATNQLELRYLGMRDDVTSLMSEYEVLAHPTPAPEPFGLVVAEAILAGCFVISSAMGGVRELLPSEMLECRFDPHNPESLISAMRAVREAQARYRRRQAQVISELSSMTSEKGYSENLRSFFSAVGSSLA